MARLGLRDVPRTTFHTSLDSQAIFGQNNILHKPKNKLYETSCIMRINSLSFVFM